MRLEYNLLWLDNDLNDYIDTGEVKSIYNFLIDLGFEPNIVTVFDEADLEKYLDIDYDLIISDFNLNKVNGDVIIYRLREEKRLNTEILFYSAKTKFVELPEVKEKLAFMERINIQIGRDTLLNKIEKVIELTVRKLLEINATRGLITAATSELDVEIERIVMHLVSKNNLDEDKLKEIIKGKVVTPLEKRLETFWEKFESFQAYFHKIDAVKKWEIFRELLKPLKKGNKDIEDFLKLNTTYQSEVIEIRNKFAHSKSEINGEKLILRGQLGKDDFEFDTEACVRIRRKLILHKKSIESLKEYLNQI